MAQCVHPYAAHDTRQNVYTHRMCARQTMSTRISASISCVCVCAWVCVYVCVQRLCVYSFYWGGVTTMGMVAQSCACVCACLCVCVCVCVCVCMCVCVCTAFVCILIYPIPLLGGGDTKTAKLAKLAMGWPRLVGSLKS